MDLVHLLVRAEWRHPSRRRKSVFGSKADMAIALRNVHCWPKADIAVVDLS